MPNINFEVEGHVSDVIEAMIRAGYAKTKTEAIRIALFNFEKDNDLFEDELYRSANKKIDKGIKSGKVKVSKFSLKELD